MRDDLRRRAYLDAMQVDSWIPRVQLPFAALSRPGVLAPAELPLVVNESVELPVAEAVSEPLITQAPFEPARHEAHGRDQLEAPESEVSYPLPPTGAPGIPRFTLQLMRAGNCALLVELPTGEPLQARDPEYILLKDLLRAAGLPDAPQMIGEAVRWPLLKSRTMDQGPQAALDFVQSFLGARLEEQEPCACLWLVGLSAIRFAANADAQAYNRKLMIDDLGVGWALPGLDLLMEEPERKRPLWEAMKRVRNRWNRCV